MPSHHLDQLATRGYTVLDSTYSSEDIQLFRAAMQAVYDKLGRPLLSRRDKTDLGNGSVLSGSGLAIGRVLEHAPEVAPRLLNAEARAVLRATLGPSVDTEVVAGVISDHNRSMHPWHHHIGGPDEDI